VFEALSLLRLTIDRGLHPDIPEKGICVFLIFLHSDMLVFPENGDPNDLYLIVIVLHVRRLHARANA
jgi:hypothetical protein